jgi:hypothetical protein
MDDNLDKFQKLEKWLIDNGASFPKLYLKVLNHAMFESCVS